MADKNLITRVARWSATHAWLAILGWLAFVVLCLVVNAAVGTVPATSNDYRVGEAGRAEQITTDAGMPGAEYERVLITAKDGQTATAADLDAAAADVTQRMKAIDQIREVGAPLHHTNPDAVLVPIYLKAGDTWARDNIQVVLDTTAGAQAAHPGLRIEETGSVSIDNGIDVQLGKDLQLAEKITLPATLIILLLVFGALVAAGIPVLLALSSVVAAMGLAGIASHIVPDAGATRNVILLMGMAVGVDYSLFYLKREREERARAGGKISPAAAVELAAATSGHTVLVSGLAVTAAMLGLYIEGDVVFSSLATSSVIVVLVAMIASLTVLPALLVKCNRALDWPMKRRHQSEDRPGRVWSALLRPAVRAPWITLAGAALVMLALAVPALTMQVSLPGNASLPHEVPQLKTWDRMLTLFPASGVVHVVVVKAPAAEADNVSAALTQLAARAAADPLFVKTDPGPVTTSADRTVSRILIPISFSSDAPGAKESLDHLRGQLAPASLGALNGAEYAVSGDVGRDADTVKRQEDRLPWVVLFVVVLTFVVMWVAYRSLVIAAIAVLLNLLSAAAAFGALALVFQHTWAEPLLDFTSSGFIVSRVPLFLFVILFGLSMDYHVFVVSRIRELVKRGVPTREAVYGGASSSAGVITGAALVMVSVFASFVFTGLLEMKELGFGLAVAVLLDAFIIRVFMLPSLLSLLGRHSWWPSPLSRAQAAPPVESSVAAGDSDRLGARG
ncbi:MMPL family transporter [Dactylosporangium vinaceum]|uniref:MMPL family transporter n=1 Tax=Dactylosporangium vinaceum TaxID=53362 RepID=A0ABV5ML76_9ACTN|nr:MMPL family transporter [Dactylosporangium vinaceum]UAB94072.1 MMPL family transporter [Dactylosporangium vinaceum]